LWLSLIEKAFAKYYGSYEMLERGYVHHALQDLTGCEAECIPLSSVSRGVGKRALWDSLLRYRANGYILGAGTGDSNLVDKEIQDMGIVFDAAYTIYDVRYMDGHRLLKLRNPPGDHDEWKGDWSDKSPLWSKKLKQKLGHSDAEDDNTFFIAFDDFCNVFRNLYVCKYYNPARWFETIHPGTYVFGIYVHTSFIHACIYMLTITTPYRLIHIHYSIQACGRLLTRRITRRPKWRS
jgi:hypothetical protein